MSAWRFLAMATDHDDLRIDGRAVWDVEWRATRLDPVRLQHPRQRHRFGIDDIGDRHRSVRFAARELSPNCGAFDLPET
jgi:hypothetical protein